MFTKVITITKMYPFVNIHFAKSAFFDENREETRSWAMRLFSKIFSRGQCLPACRSYKTLNYCNSDELLTASWSAILAWAALEHLLRILTQKCLLFNCAISFQIAMVIFIWFVNVYVIYYHTVYEVCIILFAKVQIRRF